MWRLNVKRCLLKVGITQYIGNAKLDCLLSFRSGNFEQYVGQYKLRKTLILDRERDN
jgi:hypothetical protein